MLSRSLTFTSLLTLMFAATASCSQRTIMFEIIYFYYAYRIAYEANTNVLVLSPDCKSSGGGACDFDEYVQYIITADQKAYYKPGQLGVAPLVDDAARFLIQQSRSPETQTPVHNAAGFFTGMYSPARVCTFNEGASKVPWITLIRQVMLQVQAARKAAESASDSVVRRDIELFVGFAAEAIQNIYQIARFERAEDTIHAFEDQFPDFYVRTSEGSAPYAASKYSYFDSYGTLAENSLFTADTQSTYSSIISWAKSYGKGYLQNLEVLQQTYQALTSVNTCS